MDPPTKGTNYEKGERFLQLSLKALDELDSLSKNKRLSESQKASYVEAHRNGKILSEETIRIRNKLLTQKKPLRRFLVNLFVRDSSTKHFYKVSYRNYSSIRRTSDDLNRLLVSEIDALLTSGSLGESAQGNEAVNEENLRDVVEDNLAEGRSPNENTQGMNLDVHTEQVQETRAVILGEEDEEDGSTRSPCDVVEGNHSAEGLSLNENTQDINLDVYSEQGVQEAFAICDRLGIKFSKEEDEDDTETIRPSPYQSRAPSPSSTGSCTINIFYNIKNSVVSFDSESTGTTMNVGDRVDEGVGSVYHG
ncbi:hypothetical protein EV702DRAFT_1276204 [Suillus placidus]|uniref:Uncharacterized protein n=1 Tax=Suillus placidus TaxID=48579 RepID=A0A9P7D6N3_9AGAM|nr:hypothetical protein EV702DRAFT_1276204 [Suillus placidus]